MKEKPQILIVGAGPSGLSMALFLRKMGYPLRIVDRKKSISPYSKALAVNPRSLEILEPYGLADKFLHNGRKMTSIQLWQGDRPFLGVNLSTIKHAYPFMLLQTQKESEEILMESLNELGVQVEYGLEWLGMEERGGLIRSQLKGEGPEAYEHHLLIGADGGHSAVREAVEIDLEGFRYDEEWELYDLEMEGPFKKEEAHIRFFPEGGMIMLPIEENLWRIAGNMKSLLNFLPKGTSMGQIEWESRFRIHHKVATQLTKGNIALIGDAAHLHSPMGARGMNLGIEDAYLLSQLIQQKQMPSFDAQRLPYLRRTVRRINTLTMGIAGTSNSASFLRKNLGLLKVFAPFVIPSARKFAMGLNK